MNLHASQVCAHPAMTVDEQQSAIVISLHHDLESTQSKSNLLDISTLLSKNLVMIVAHQIKYVSQTLPVSSDSIVEVQTS